MLKPLADIKPPDLIQFDRSSFVDEIIERIKLNSNWKSIWNDSLYQNADQMVLNFFAYMFEKNAVSFNFNLKEKFLIHAFSDEAIYQNLSDIGVDVQQATNASVDATISLSSNLIREPLVFDKFYSIPGSNINNQTINFEVISKDNNNKYNYLDNVIVNTEFATMEYFTLTLYAGTTYYEEFELSEYTLENMQLKLSYNNIENNSVRAYYNDPDGKMIELNEVSILNTSGEINTIFTSGTPSFKIKYDKNNFPVLMFGTVEFGGAFETNHVNGKIIVFYRKAYGESGNILSGGINCTKTVDILGTEYEINIINESSAAGGRNIEDLQVAKLYGPLRIGRNGAFIDERDAQLSLKNSVIKHEIETPKMSTDNGIPFMHAVHQIVPIRNFENFEFEDFAIDDTITSYSKKIIIQFTEYCKVIGAHDKSVVDEYVTDFVYPNDDGSISFAYILKNTNPMSSSLRATAYDENDKILDYIRWDGNYILNPKLAASTHDKVTRVRSKTFASIAIIDNQTNNSSGSNNGKNNKCIIEFDDYGHIFELTLPIGTKTYKEFATILNDLIINEIKGTYSTTYANDTRGAVTNMLHLINHVFVSSEVVSTTNLTGRLIFNSTKTGRKSKIKFHNYNIINTNQELDLYYMLGVGVYSYRPGRETGWVFNDSLIYNYETNQIFFDIYSDNINKEQIVTSDEYGDNLVQLTGSKDGPVLSFILTVENGIKEKLLLNYDLNIFAEKYNETTKAFDTISHVIFEGIVDSDENYVAIGPNDPRVTDADALSVFKTESDYSYYDYDNSKLNIQVVDGTENPYYVSSFGEINQIKMQEITIGVNGTQIVFNDVSGGLSKIFLPSNGSWSQDPTSAIGVKFNLSLAGLNLETGKSYKLTFIYIDNSLVQHELDYIVFANVDINDNFIEYTYINMDPTQQVVSRNLGSSSTGTFMNAVDKIIHIATSNPEADGTLKTYSQSWADFDRIRITYSSKNFDHITINYIPNKYSPEGEAKAILDKIKDKNNRLIGVENTIKNINYIPFAPIIVLKINKKYPLYDAVNAVKNLVFENYKYDNYNTEHSINTKPTAEIIKNLIDKISADYGIISATVDNSLNTYIDKYYSEPCYFFIMDETSQGKLLSLENEATNENIETISNNYKININASFGD